MQLPSARPAESSSESCPLSPGDREAPHTLGPLQGCLRDAGARAYPGPRLSRAPAGRAPALSVTALWQV